MKFSKEEIVPVVSMKETKETMTYLGNSLLGRFGYDLSVSQNGLYEKIVLNTDNKEELILGIQRTTSIIKMPESTSNKNYASRVNDFIENYDQEAAYLETLLACINDIPNPEERHIIIATYIKKDSVNNIEKTLCMSGYKRKLYLDNGLHLLRKMIPTGIH